MIIGVTGHRSVEQRPGELLEFARLSVSRMIEIGCSAVLTGMARGWDLAIARAAYEQKLRYVAVVPFMSQSRHWSREDAAEWSFLMSNASSQVIISAAELYVAYRTRNEYIVDSCEELWSLWDGRSVGGTRHCVLHAESVRRTVEPLWERWIDFREERKDHAVYTSPDRS